MHSFWQIIPALAAVISGGLIFACPKDVKRFHKYMGFTLIFDGLWMMLSSAVRFQFESLSLSLYFLSLAMMLVTPFFYYLSCRYLLKEEGVKKSDFWMLEAVAVFLTASIVAAVHTNSPDRAAFINVVRGEDVSGISTGASVLLAFDNLALIFFLLEFAATFAFCHLGLRKYAKNLESYYSNSVKTSTAYVTALSILMAVKLLTFALPLFVPSLVLSDWAVAVKAILDVIFYSAIAFLSIRTVFTSEELAKALKASEAKAEKTPAASDVIEERLSKLIENKFFLNPDVDLFGISDEIHVNAKYVGEYIRYKYGASFMVFVNKLRVEHSIELMKDKELSLQAISDESGFITPSTFYRNFIKIIGESPSEYRKKL